MAKVDTGTYTGRDRRNGGKLRLSGSDYIKILIGLFTLFTGSIIFYDRTNRGIAVLAKDVEDCKTTNEAQEKAIITVQKDIQQIRGNMESMQLEQKALTLKFDNKFEESNKILYKILGALENDGG